MGNYASTAQVETRIGTKTLYQLTSDTGTSVTTAKVEEAIGMGESLIDSHAARRFQTPVDFAAHPELEIPLRGLTIDFARYHLANLRPPVPEDWTKAYEMGLKWVEKLGKGEVEPGSTDTPASTESRAPIGVLTSQDRNASRENMADL